MSANGILCRMCAEIVYDARNIYDNDYDDIQYICKFKQLFSDIVFEEDGYNLPEQICSNCCTKLEDASNFKKQCISSLEYLKKCNRNFEESEPENCDFGHVDIKQEVDWNEKLIENNGENIECDTPKNCTKSEKAENCQEPRNKFAGIQKDQKTSSKILRETKGKEEARKLHFSVLKLKKLYPQVHVLNLLHGLDLDPFVSLTPLINHNLFHGYGSEKMNDDNKSATTRASSKVNGHRTNINSEVYKIEEKNAKVPVQNSEEFYTCFVCQKSFRSHLELKTHVTLHLKHFDENDTVIRLSDNIIKEENLEIIEELAESNEQTILAEDQSITQVSKMKTENINARIEDTEGGKNIVDFTEKQIIHENIKEGDLTEKNTKEMTLTGYLCAEEFVSSCTICNRGIVILRKYLKYLEKSIMKVHEKRDTTIHRGIKPYSCNECHKKCKHMIAHSGVKPYSCNECPKEFTRKSNLEQHMNIHSGVKPYSCNECQKKFGDKSSLKRHVKSVHKGLKPYSCNECYKKFSQKSDLVLHMNVHSGVKPYSCNDCHEKFSRKSSLERHINVHSDLKPYSCNECQKKFRDKSNLKHHVNGVHRDTKQYSCNECGKKFNWKHSLQRHMNVHSGVKPYSCNVCHKRFIRKSELAQHMNVHSGVKPYSCDDCHKKFSQKSSLERHMSVHSDVKPYSCNECHKKFSYKSNLERHANVHSGVKPYSCNECQKKFSRKSLLKRHVDGVHRGMKQYICNECDKKFSRKYELEHHINVHRGIKPYSCNECQKKFGEKLSLKRHMKRFHSGV